MPSSSPAWQSMRFSWPLLSTQTSFLLPIRGLGYLAYLQSARDASLPKAMSTADRAGIGSMLPAIQH